MNGTSSSSATSTFFKSGKRRRRRRGEIKLQPIGARLRDRQRRPIPSSGVLLAQLCLRRSIGRVERRLVLRAQQVGDHVDDA